MGIVRVCIRACVHVYIVCCVMCDVWYVMCDLWCALWCAMCEVWYVMCDVWCVNDVWCDAMWDVWCVIDVWCYVMWCDVIWCDVMWCDVMCCDVRCGVMWCHVMRCNVMWGAYDEEVRGGGRRTRSMGCEVKREPTHRRVVVTIQYEFRTDGQADERTRVWAHRSTCGQTDGRANGRTDGFEIKQSPNTMTLKLKKKRER